MSGTGIKAKRDSNLWEREPDNWYPEPAWCSARLFEVEAFPGPILDPFAGMGRIVQSARAAGLKAHGTDLRRRGFAGVVGGHDWFGPDWQHDRGSIVTNPPYGRRPKADVKAGERDRFEEEALRLALHRGAIKVALFLDAKWTNSAARGKWLETLPLARVYLLGPRPSCPPGPVIMAGEAAGSGTTDFSWFVFDVDHVGPPSLHWLRRDR